MLSRSVFFTTSGLKPNNLHQAHLIQEIFETMVTLQIQKNLNDKAYEHLIVSYKYDLQRPDLSSDNFFNIVFTPEEEMEMRSVHHLVGKAVDDIIEEFYIFDKHNTRVVLNFNCCLLNRHNFVLTAEVIAMKE